MSGYGLPIFGVITTVVGVYVAASFALAQKQMMAATRLQAYLTHWRRWAEDAETYWLFEIGERWDNEELAILRRGGSSEEVARLRESHKTLCAQIANGEYSGENGIPKEYLAILKQNVSHVTRESLALLLDTVKVGRQNLITGQQFITDEEASLLGLQMAYHSISLKNGVVDLSDSIIFMFASAVEKGMDDREFSVGLYKLLWKASNVSKDYHCLLRQCHTLTASTVLKLTGRNIIDGSRITRR